MRCLRKRRADRYQSVHSLRGALTGALRRARELREAEEAEDEIEIPQRDLAHRNRR